jgi:hypothetical protein
MPVVNVGLQRYRDLMRGSGSMNAPADSLGFGTNNAADDPDDDRLGGASAPGNVSYWKTSSDVTITSGGDGTTSPWFQFAATFGTGEANDTLGEIGISAGSLNGTDPAGNDGTNLVTRRAIGPFTKSSVFEIEGRVRVDHEHETL